MHKSEKGSPNYMCRCCTAPHCCTFSIPVGHFLLFTFLCLTTSTTTPPCRLLSFYFSTPTSRRRVELLPPCVDNHAVCSGLIQTSPALLGIASPQLLVVRSTSSSPAAPGLIREPLEINNNNSNGLKKKKAQHTAVIYSPPPSNPLVWIYARIVLLAQIVRACETRSGRHG